MSGPVGVGLVGAGDVSAQYLKSLLGYPDVSVVGVADLDAGRAREVAAAHGIGYGGPVAGLLELDAVELVVNLTVPAAHAEVARAAIAAGRHVWGEKPLAVDRSSARSVLDAAAAAGVMVGNAPDTILGTAVQHSQRLLADGVIGTPATVLTLMQGPGPERWHPRPQFLFARGAGPLFDIGPYYVTTLVQLLGPVVSVSATGHRARASRVVGSGPLAGTVFPVEVDTHVSVLTRFASGVVGTSVYSFDSPVRRQAFEVTGEGGTMEVPVSGFDGPTRVLRDSAGDAAWETLAPPADRRDRGVGVLEMARAIRSGRAPRASGELAYHVLDVLLAVSESAAAGGAPVSVGSSAGPVPLLEPGWSAGASTLAAR